MKIITHTTVRLRGKDGEHDYRAPGEHDLDDKVAADLLKRGHAKTPAQVAKDTAPKGDAPSVTKGGDKPKGGGK